MDSLRSRARCSRGLRTRLEIRGQGRPGLGNAAFALDVAHARADAIAAIGFDSSRDRTLLGRGCRYYLSTRAVLLPLRTDAAGRARLQCPIPETRSLLDLRLVAQAAVLDPQGAWVGLASFSNALVVTVGE